MPPPCTVCTHAKRIAIDVRALDPFANYSAIAREYGFSNDALGRHMKKHLGPKKDQRRTHQAVRRSVRSLEKREEILTDSVRAMDLGVELARLFRHAERMLLSADEWLRDPSNPERYELGPRGSEIDVVAVVGRGRRKARLDAFLQEIGEGLALREELAEARGLLKAFVDRGGDRGGGDQDLAETARTVLSRTSTVPASALEVKWRQADPRKLFLDAIGELRQVLEMGARLTGEIKGTQLSVTIQAAPEWLLLRARLVEELRGVPGGMEALMRACGEAGNGPGHEESAVQTSAPGPIDVKAIEGER